MAEFTQNVIQMVADVLSL